MRPPSTLLQFHKMLWLFCTVLMLFNNVANAEPQGGNQPEPGPAANAEPQGGNQPEPGPAANAEPQGGNQPEPGPAANAEPQGDQQTIGIGLIQATESNDGTVILPKVSRDSLLDITKDATKYKNYSPKGAKCKVQFNADGGIEVIYDDDTSKNGCSMDLVVKDEGKDEVSFIAKLWDNECIVYTNLLPFSIGNDNAYLKARTTGPEDGDVGDCANQQVCKNKENNGQCMKSTVLEIGWYRSPSIYGLVHQVGEPDASLNILIVQNQNNEWMMDVKMTSDKDKNINVKINGVGRQNPMKEFPKDGTPVCNKPEQATKGPITWKVNQASDELKDKRIVFFHFFPQTATRLYEKGIKPLLSNSPECKGKLSFIFNNTEGLLMVAQPQPSPPPPPQTDSPASEQWNTTMDQWNTTMDQWNTTMATGSNAADTTTNPAGPTKPPQSNRLMIILIVIGSVVGVIAVVILVYCCCCRGEKTEDADSVSDVEGGGAVVVHTVDEDNEDKDEDEDENKEESAAAGS